MCGPAVTIEKLLLVSKTLGRFIDLRKELRKLVVHHSDNADGYSDDFIADAKRVTDYIKSKVWGNTGENPEDADFDCNFWYRVEVSEKQTDISPSELCEAGSLKVTDYLVRNQQFVVKIREKIHIVGEEADSDSESEKDDDDSDDSGYESP